MIVKSDISATSFCKPFLWSNKSSASCIVFLHYSKSIVFVGLWFLALRLLIARVLAPRILALAFLLYEGFCSLRHSPPTSSQTFSAFKDSLSKVLPAYAQIG